VQKNREILFLTLQIAQVHFQLVIVLEEQVLFTVIAWWFNLLKAEKIGVQGSAV